MPAPLSLDLRRRVLETCLDRSLARRAVAERFKVSLGFVEKLLRRHRSTGEITPRTAPGKPCSLTPDDDQTLINLLAHNNDATIAELTEHMRAATGRTVSTSAVSRTLIRLNLTRKKNTSSQRATPRRCSAGTGRLCGDPTIA